MEGVAETSEELLDLYFETGTLPEEKLKRFKSWNYEW